MKSDVSFFEKLSIRTKESNSLLCIGLDPHPKDLFPDDDIKCKSEDERCNAAFTFCKTIIDLTVEHAAAYKPNAAFFESLGCEKGMATLRAVIKAIPDEIPVLLDVKRGDIGSTSSSYADACYDVNGLSADGVTLCPLMGFDSVKPFVTGVYKNKGAFLLCKTSNPGSEDILNAELANREKVFERIARLSQLWAKEVAVENDSVEGTPPCFGLVVGATDSVAMAMARRAAGPDLWILAPGVGVQGGDLDATCMAGMNEDGSGLLIPVSRGISRASDPCVAAKTLKESINDARIRHLTNLATKVEKPTLMRTYQEEFIKFSLAEGVLKFGSFVTKSGRTSPYFFNAGMFSSGKALSVLGSSYAAAIMASNDFAEDGVPKFEVIFGPAYKGIPLGAVICTALHLEYGVNVGFAYNRKEAKDHGEGGIVVGSALKDKRVLVVDDVITAGTAIRESHQLLGNLEATPIGVVIALDRQEKRSLDDPTSAVQAVARDLNISVQSIISFAQLHAFLESCKDYDDSLLTRLTEYRQTYGV